MKKLINMTILAITLAASTLLSCNTPELIPEILVFDEYSIIDGDTVKTRVEPNLEAIKAIDPNQSRLLVVGDTILTYRKQLLPSLPAKSPDLSRLKDNEDEELRGKPLRMIAIGGSLTAGVRDGGYFNEGIETAYPNLIARQMGIEFNQPYFDDQDYNGVGRKVLTDFNPTGGPVPKVKEVKNNMAYIAGGEGELSLKKNPSTELDNLSFLNMNAGLFNDSRDKNIAVENSTDIDSKLSAELYRRVIPADGKSDIYSFLKEKKYDFLLLDFGGLCMKTNNKFWFSQGNTNILNQEQYINSKEDFDVSYPWYHEIDHEVKAMKELDKRGLLKNGVLFNYPNFFELPYFRLVTTSKLKAVLGSQWTLDVESLREKGTIVLPNSEIDSLLSPNVNIALKKGVRGNSHLSEHTFMGIGLVNEGIKHYDQKMRQLAKRYSMPVVDLNGLYEKVLSGEFVSQDGIRVNPAWPEGNFFSSDGIYPSAFGSAIIANATIKAINEHYSTKVPLISTAQFLER